MLRRYGRACAPIRQVGGGATAHFIPVEFDHLSFDLLEAFKVKVSKIKVTESRNIF